MMHQSSQSWDTQNSFCSMVMKASVVMSTAIFALIAASSMLYVTSIACAVAACTVAEQLSRFPVTTQHVLDERAWSRIVTRESH